MRPQGELLAPSPERIRQDLTELSEIRDPDSLGWSRTVFSEPYRASRDWIRARMVSAGLEVRRDDAGNLVGLLPGEQPSAGALVTGSHTDTVRSGGRFDGIVGVVGAVELVRQLREKGIRLDRDLLVVDFLGEESNEFGLSCLGSRALAGDLAAADLDRRDGDGVRLADRYRRFGVDPAGVLGADRSLRGRLHRYLELHVEQGPVLEERGATIGVVTAIAGIQRLLATFQGRPDHAGTMPMPERRDALVAAAEGVLAVRREGCGAPVHGVATTSTLTAEPGSPNVVPGVVRMNAEVRSVDHDWLSGARRRVAEEIRARAAEHGVEVDMQWHTDNPSVPASGEVHDVVARAADQLGLTWEAIPSGATHDAAHISRLCPMGMIFVPSRGGRSHCPDEYSDIDHISAGVQVLGASLLDLDS